MLHELAEASLPDFCTACSAIVLAGLIAVAVINLALGEQERRKQERHKQAAAAHRREQERQAELRRQAEQLEREHREREERAEFERQQALAVTIAQLKDAAEERFKGTLQAGGFEELDRRLREVQLMFSRCGRVLTARVFAVPTGWVAIEWMLDPGRPVPLRVVGKRDGKQVFAEFAHRGVYADVLARGREPPGEFGSGHV